MTAGNGGSIGVGMVGHAFMGAVHSHAWRTAHRFFDLPVVPELAVLG
ncbi:MAG: gfo/Idh/MocA family oxidoreductase, partial [Pseudonocardiaceae bacterium]|nr:gfo/Idh/MocA family oxidoreductase [Pseudonocardiaceae bacterium]